jgi:hypothetical protein
MTFNLMEESKSIAQEAWLESNCDEEEARDFIFQSCDGSEIAIYYGKAIDFCAANNTDSGEEYLEECCDGGIAQPGDCFGQIACRISFATLLCACEEALADIVTAHEESE